MKQAWSKSWIRSKQPRKQRKYRYNAPLHVKNSFLHVHLSPTLRKKYNTRSIRIRVGDTVKILRGTFKGKEVKINKVSLHQQAKVFADGIERIKKEGSKAFIPLEPSNLLLVALITSDKKRFRSDATTQIPAKAAPQKKVAEKVEKPIEKKQVQAQNQTQKAQSEVAGKEEQVKL
jgi:large subunit ribosomal protein L24